MLSANERNELRRRIVRFCQEPKTSDDIGHHFRIGGPELAGHLTWLRVAGHLTITKPGDKYVWNQKVPLTGIR